MANFPPYPEHSTITNIFKNTHRGRESMHEYENHFYLSHHEPVAFPILSFGHVSPILCHYTTPQSHVFCFSLSIVLYLTPFDYHYSFSLGAPSNYIKNYFPLHLSCPNF